MLITAKLDGCVNMRDGLNNHKFMHFKLSLACESTFDHSMHGVVCCRGSTIVCFYMLFLVV